MHKERALADAIMIGNNTLKTDNPSLTTREWQGDSPRPVLFKTAHLPATSPLLSRSPILLDPTKALEENMNLLYTEYGITSLMVEGGAKLLYSFIESGLADEIRIEVSQNVINEGVAAPSVPAGYVMVQSTHAGSNIIITYAPDSRI